MNNHYQMPNGLANLLFTPFCSSFFSTCKINTVRGWCEQASLYEPPEWWIWQPSTTSHPKSSLPSPQIKKCQVPTCFKSLMSKYKSLLLSRAIKIKDKQIVVHLYHGITLSSKLWVQKQEWISKTVCWTKKGWQKYKLYYFIYKKYKNRQNSSVAVNAIAREEETDWSFFRGWWKCSISCCR